MEDCICVRTSLFHKSVHGGMDYTLRERSPVIEDLLRLSGLRLDQRLNSRSFERVKAWDLYYYSITRILWDFALCHSCHLYLVSVMASLGCPFICLRTEQVLFRAVLCLCISVWLVKKLCAHTAIILCNDCVFSCSLSRCEATRGKSFSRSLFETLQVQRGSQLKKTRSW